MAKLLMRVCRDLGVSVNLIYRILQDYGVHKKLELNTKLTNNEIKIIEKNVPNPVREIKVRNKAKTNKNLGKVSSVGTTFVEPVILDIDKDINVEHVNYKILMFIQTFILQLSVRSQHLIKYSILPRLIANTINLNDLLDINFHLNFRNCGKKTAFELISFFEKFFQNINTNSETNENSGKEKLPISIFNFENLIILIDNHSYILSPRSFKSLDYIKKIVKENPEHLFRFLNSDYVIKNIKKIGPKSGPEISLFLKHILSFYDEHGEYNNNKIINNIKLQKLLFNLKIEINDTFYKSIENEIPSYFKIFELFLNKKLFKLRLGIINYYLNGNNYTVIGEIKGLSRERVRQIVNKFNENLNNYIKDFNKIVNESEIDFSKFINEGKKIGSQKITEKYNIKLHPKIIEKLINPEFLISKVKVDHDITPELMENFDIESMLTEIINLNRKVEADFYLPLDGFLYNYLKNQRNAHQIVNFRSEIEELIFKKTGLITSSQHGICFRRNTIFRKWEIIRDVLETHGKPMHLEEISKLTDIKEENLRGIVLKERHLFINTTLSTYGLKKWEDEGKIKGGTIIELICEFLNSKPEPSHIYQIFKHIKQFRDTTERSLDGLIKSDTQNRFLQLGAGFYGLVGVHDDYEYKVLSPLPGSWHLFLNKNYNGINVNIDHFIKREQLKFNIDELVIKANLEKRIDMGDIKIDENGILIFKKFVISQKRGRPKSTQ